MTAAIMLLLCVAIAVVGVLLATRYGGKRERELEALARRRGWSYQPWHRASARPRNLWERMKSPPRWLEPAYRGFGVFVEGEQRHAFNTLRGNLQARLADAPVTVAVMGGDFRGGGKDKHGRRRSFRIESRDHIFSYLLIELPFGRVPHTAVRRRWARDKVEELLGFGDISFESEEFSRTFHVSGEDRRFAYDLCDLRMMEFLLSGEPPTFEVRGRYLLVCGSRLWSAAHFERNVEWACGFMQRWPRHLVDQLRRGRRAGPGAARAVAAGAGGA